MLGLFFYTTKSCHLCEEAAQLLEKLQLVKEVNIEAVDISENDSLVRSYGLRIPVVKNKQSGKEIDWPFIMDDLIDLVELVWVQILSFKIMTTIKLVKAVQSNLVFR